MLHIDVLMKIIVQKCHLLISASIFDFISMIVNLSRASHSMDGRDRDAMISNFPRPLSCLGTIYECLDLPSLVLYFPLPSLASYYLVALLPL